MSPFLQVLKSWRKTRRISQLELALKANVSARHISFLETGRARPSAEMVERLGEALDLPLAVRNQLLGHAGFAARYPGRRLDDAAMAPIRAAIAHTLERHAPYPALAVDRLWTVIRMNEPAAALFGEVGVGEGSSLLELMVSDRLPPLIENWPDVARHAAQRLRTESTAQGGIAALDATAEKLGRVGSTKRSSVGPVVPTVWRSGTRRLALFATLAQFGTPEDVTLDDLKIELYFPADEATSIALRALAARSSAPMGSPE